MTIEQLEYTFKDYFKLMAVSDIESFVWALLKENYNLLNKVIDFEEGN